MARQQKKSQRVYDDKHKVKCGKCGNDFSMKNLHLVKICGVLKWVCSVCSSRMNRFTQGSI